VSLLDPEAVPPDSPRVAARCGVLVSMVHRAALEEGAAPSDLRRLIRWMEDADLDAEMEEGERALFRVPLGGLDPARRTDAAWQAEGAAVLSWALARSVLPDHDEPADGPAIARILGFLEPVWTLPWRAVLRPAREIERRWASAAAYHWRMAEYRHHRRPVDFATYLEECPWGRVDAADFDLEGGDLLLRGRPLAAAGEEVVARCHAIAGERHRAFAWLMGFEPAWSKVPTET